jgi:hypothetical protein
MKKVMLDESELPQRWYNILPDLPEPPQPYRHPVTLQPMGPDDLAPIFPQAIIAQEVSGERWIEIPDQVREIYRIWRPTPLYGRTGSKRPWTRPPTSTTSSKAGRRPAPTSRTRPCPRPTTTPRRASGG